jgi:predicted glycogen debranching enzyme
MLLVNGLETWAVRGNTREALSSQRYHGDVVHPDGSRRLASFAWNPWPRWTYRLDGGGTVTQELLIVRRTGVTLIIWTADDPARDVTLAIRLLMSGRDYHALQHENEAFRFAAEGQGTALVFRLYAGVPTVAVETTGTYEHQPDWYRRFLYSAERERGLDDIEDLATPGLFRLPLRSGRAALALASSTDALARPEGGDLLQAAAAWQTEERDRRARVGSPLDLAADAYVVERGGRSTIVAGYPWFTDWGRDTFIAMRGLCLATGRWTTARDILLEWSAAVSEGMLPNRFPDRGERPEFNSVDASLWFVVVAGELERAVVDRAGLLGSGHRRRLHDAIDAILTGYANGTRHGIRADDDGLLSCGVTGSQLTWMDAKIGDWVVTPRVGKPVEVQALWLNALAVGARQDRRWRAQYDKGVAAFEPRFWNAQRACLFDVVDVDHVPGRVDATLRPNQVFAVGGLPIPLLRGDAARQVVATVERALLTPLGLRSLAAGEPGYAGVYAGDSRARDAVYHQGTVWPWLIGAFVEAWLRVAGDTPARRDEARRRFLAPLHAHLEVAGLGHVSEIADAEPPFTPRGCPFQAWSLGEVLRLERTVLAADLQPASTA